MNDEEMLEFEINSAKQRDENLNKLKSYLPKDTIIEITYHKDLLGNNDYIQACDNYQGDVYVYSSFNNIKNLWTDGKDPAILTFIKNLKKDEILYILPSNLEILQLYAVKESQLEFFRKNFKDYSIIESIYNNFISKNKQNHDNLER